MKRKCDNCGRIYDADERNLKRGWGLCCSKSCAASKREKARPSYNKQTVLANNHKRENWFDYYDNEECDDGMDFLLECGSWD